LDRPERKEAVLLNLLDSKSLAAPNFYGWGIFYFN
jgi:hypothetical protein